MDLAQLSWYRMWMRSIGLTALTAFLALASVSALPVFGRQALIYDERVAEASAAQGQREAPRQFPGPTARANALEGTQRSASQTSVTIERPEHAVSRVDPSLWTQGPSAVALPGHQANLAAREGVGGAEERASWSPAATVGVAAALLAPSVAPSGIAGANAQADDSGDTPPCPASGQEALAASDPEVVRLAIISDTHAVGPPNQSSVVRSSRVMEMLRCWGPEMLAVTGDIVSERPRDYETQFGYLMTAFAMPPVPRALVLGNHDVANSPGLTMATIRAAFPPDASSWLVDGELYGSRDVAGLHVVVLDTTYQVHEPALHTGLDTGTNNVQGYVPAAQREWLRNDLAATTLPTIVFLHQGTGTTDPSWPVGSSLANAAELRAVFEAAPRRVIAVISGHSHRWLEATVEGVRYFAVNSISFPVGDIDENDLGNHARLELDTRSRTLRWSKWVDNSVTGYREVGSIVGTY